MTEYIIHPLRQMIVREDVLYKDEYALDRLNTDLSYKREKARGKFESPMGLLKSVKGTKGKEGKMVIPTTGWVRVHASKDVSLDEIWKIAMGKVGNKDYVL